MILLKKNYNNRQMLYIAKEIIEDERNNIKNSDNGEGFKKDNTIENFTVRTLATSISKYNCYNLKVKVWDENKEVELNTYVTKKK